MLQRKESVKVQKVVTYSLTGAVKYCRSRGYPITKGGIRKIIFLHPEIFYKSFSYEYKSEIYKDELDTYISLPKDVPDESYITIANAVKEYGLQKIYIYWLIDTKKIIPKRFGKGYGIMYLRREEIGKLAERYRENNKGKQENA